jgi:hypothetical protein
MAMKFIGIIIILCYWMKGLETISGKMLWYWNCNKFMTIRPLRTKVITQRSYHQMDTRRFAFILCLIKHDGRHKARLVADGHLTDVTLDSVYTFLSALKDSDWSNSLQSSTIMKYGPLILVMHTWKRTPLKRFTSMLDRNLVA